ALVGPRRHSQGLLEHFDEGAEAVVAYGKRDIGHVLSFLKTLDRGDQAHVTPPLRESHAGLRKRTSAIRYRFQVGSRSRRANLPRMDARLPSVALAWV